MSTSLVPRPALRAAALALLAPAALLLCARPVAAQCPPGNLPGAVSACTESGAAPASDGFDAACAVYLRAAPGSGGAASKLPAGDYVFQVTDPSGAVLLSGAGPQNGILTVGPGQDGFSAYAGSHQVAGDGGAGELRVQLCPFVVSPNPGGVYKLWLTRRDCYEPGKGTHGFLANKSKTHTFKLASAPAPATATLAVQRYVDRDADGHAEGETLQDGVRYVVSVSTLDDGAPFELVTGTAGPGTARLEAIPVPATYSVCELVPGTGTAGCWWWGTQPSYAVTAGAAAPACVTGSLEADDQATVVFGAACVCQATDGVERRHWLGRSGRELLLAHDPAWRTVINRAGFVRASGAPFQVPSGTFRDAYSAFSSWLQSEGTANTAHAVSTEAAAALLAVEYGLLAPMLPRLHRPDQAACMGANTITPAEAIARAQAAIASDAFTPAGDRAAGAQHCLRVVLEGLNSRAMPWLNGHGCEPVYP